MGIEIPGLKEYGSVRDAYDRLNDILEEAEKLKAYIDKHKEGAEFVKAEEGDKFEKTSQRLETLVEEDDPKVYSVRIHIYRDRFNIISIPGMESYINNNLALKTKNEIRNAQQFSKIDYTAADQHRGEEQRLDISEEGPYFFIRRLGKGISKKIIQYARHKKDIEEIHSLERYEFIQKEIGEILK